MPQFRDVPIGGGNRSPPGVPEPAYRMQELQSGIGGHVECISTVGRNEAVAGAERYQQPHHLEPAAGGGLHQARDVVPIRVIDIEDGPDQS